jgi:hypothetical protein
MNTDQVSPQTVAPHCSTCGDLAQYSLWQKLCLQSTSELINHPYSAIGPFLNWTTFIALGFFTALILIAIFRYSTLRGNLQKKKSANLLVVWSILPLLIIIGSVWILYFLGGQSFSLFG